MSGSAASQIYGIPNVARCIASVHSSEHGGSDGLGPALQRRFCTSRSSALTPHPFGLASVRNKDFDCTTHQTAPDQGGQTASAHHGRAEDGLWLGSFPCVNMDEPGPNYDNVLNEDEERRQMKEKKHSAGQYLNYTTSCLLMEGSCRTGIH